MQKKTLKIIIKKQFFDLIKQGKKKKEYRKVSKFWVSRLYDYKKEDFKQYDYIEFINGYSKNARRLIVEFKGIILDKKNHEFVIKLGSEVTILYLYAFLQLFTP